MGLFDGVLGSGESLFRDEEALNPDFLPKLLPYRDQQQSFLASCIKPLLEERDGRNAFVFGAPGIGKTAAVRWVLRDLEEQAEGVATFYINCWQKSTTFQIYVYICNQMDYMFTQNKRSEELLEIIKSILNKKTAVFVFDEVDKAEDYEFLYSLMNEIFHKSIILITNYKEWLADLEDRLKSRLLPAMLEFKAYNAVETEGILKQRCDYAFVPGVWDPLAFSMVAKAVVELQDIRAGIHLLQETGRTAEDGASKKILITHAQKAITQIKEMALKSPADLEEDTKLALQVVQENSGTKIGDLFKLYKEKGGEGTYKTFQRKIAKLEKNDFVATNRVTGKEGNTTLVSTKEKKLSEF